MKEELRSNFRELLFKSVRVMVESEYSPSSGGKFTFPTLSLLRLSLSFPLKGFQGGIHRSTQKISGLGRWACLRWLTSIRPFSCALILIVAVTGFACSSNRAGGAVPPEVESTISTISEEIAAERYEKVYNEASELWRQDATLEQSITAFKTLRTKLGPVENRILQSATEQQNSGGPLKGRAYIVTYRTKFQNGEGMETFTLIERDSRWLLARYFVNSTALK
jgi:hypothetical protein